MRKLHFLGEQFLSSPPPVSVINIGSIVEADYKDAWVTGFLVKEIDDDKCLRFNNH
ncbi:unnamed protein product [Arabidopsis arenosa]|uniref:Uncharacterized protein n=1 Tax=Arabidopsis arenosa TaxID=38785 RepID=A0A8S2B3H4_ARAAE|nr:unnamed protein product [Arabidopsis arenosa]